ncbi:FecR family protein [Achromobacter marplatensis]|uniref:FecR family protein n=1 Tax=Achromobacter marplatensis TaxID=470868 RepID=UPI003C73E9E0
MSPWSGTAFDVRAASPHVVVKVLHGRVRVTPDRARADETVSLGAEQGVAVDPATGMHQPVVAVADSVGGWRNGRLVFRRTPLAEVAEEVAQYLGKPVTFEAPQLRTLTVSGFATTDAPAAFLEALPDLLPVRVKRGADGGYVIADR